jgi:hypothetical protein
LINDADAAMAAEIWRPGSSNSNVKNAAMISNAFHWLICDSLI